MCTTTNNINQPFNIEDLNKLVEIIEEENKLTPKERTLKATDDKYDTIFVSNEDIKELIIRKYGELNIVVCSIAGDKIIFFDSRYKPFYVTSMTATT